jgi:hypothetical protein
MGGFHGGGFHRSRVRSAALAGRLIPVIFATVAKSWLIDGWKISAVPNPHAISQAGYLTLVRKSG